MSLKNMRALGRLKTGAMNRTEQSYSDYLTGLQRAGEVLWFRFEGFKLRLADKTFYTPDFAVLTSTNALECHEVKGFWQDDARVKIKVAAEMYPFKFIAITKKRGAWVFEDFA